MNKIEQQIEFCYKIAQYQLNKVLGSFDNRTASELGYHKLSSYLKIAEHYLRLARTWAEWWKGWADWLEETLVTGGVVYGLWQLVTQTALGPWFAGVIATGGLPLWGTMIGTAVVAYGLTKLLYYGFDKIKDKIEGKPSKKEIIDAVNGNNPEFAEKIRGYFKNDPELLKEFLKSLKGLPQGIEKKAIEALIEAAPEKVKTVAAITVAEKIHAIPPKEPEKVKAATFQKLTTD